MRMERLTLLVICFVWALALPAQSWDPVYFPADLLAKEEVRAVVEFETEIRDPKDLAGSGNRIRLARDINWRIYFDTLGQKEQKIFYDGNEEKTRDELEFLFNDAGQIIRKTYIYPQVANVLPQPDSGVVTPIFRHERSTYFFYHPNGKRNYRLVRNLEGGVETLTDSIHFSYDVLGRLFRRTRYVRRDSTMDSLVTNFSHFARGMRIANMAGKEVQDREILRFDTEGRLITREYFSGKSTAPRLREMYTYDPRGRLSNVEFAHDWNHFERADRIIHRENVYDDHGKLSEAILDYGDGRRVLKFYDYTYYTGEE